MNTKHGIFLAMFSFLVFCAFIGTASADTIYVPDDYAKIQWAIDNATDGDTIIVRDGTYVENVNVNTRLTIRSESGSAKCIVQAAKEYDPVFEVTVDYVNISGFAVEGATKGSGISLHYANYCDISNNNVLNNWNGICLGFSSNNNLRSNNAMSSTHGVVLRHSDDNTLTNNNAWNNYKGIHLDYSNNNTLTNNIMSANEYNFGVVGSSYNSEFIHNIDTSNKVDGKPIYYLMNGKNKQIPSNAGYVGIVNCINITVKNLTLTNNFQGTLLANSSNSKIENVNASSNNCDGIYLDHSSNNTLINNNASNNANCGVKLRYSNNNTLTNNDATYNDVGICLGGHTSENEIAKNNAYPNKRLGIEIAAFQSERNKIYMNNFKGSTSGPSGPTSGPPQIEFRSAPSLVVHFHYDMGMLVGATAYAGLENTGGSGAVEIVARISSPSGTIAVKSSTFDIESDGVYDLEIEITMCEVGVGVEEDYNLVLSSPSASSSHEIGLGDYRSLSASIRAINLIPVVVVPTNPWHSTEKINYTYKGKNYTNYLGNYWTDYEGIDANGDGIGDTPYYVQTDKDNYPLMEHWENYFAHQEQRGDLNSDGEVTSADAAIALWMAVSGAHNEGADVNRDGMVTPLDALMILQAAAGAVSL